VKNLAEDFLKQWESKTFEEVWDAIIPWHKPYPCHNSGEPNWKPTPCPGPTSPTPGIVRGEACYMCGERNCHESMPHGNHPDWLAFVAGDDDPNDPWGVAQHALNETLGEFEMRIADLPEEARFAARRARLPELCIRIVETRRYRHRKISAAGRKRIAAARRERWAKIKAAKK
jgi:hypothetical protein